MIRLLKTKWTAVALGTAAYSLTTWLCLQPGKQLSRIVAETTAASQSRPLSGVGPSWDFENPEMAQLISELRDQREALRTRALQLDELEARLKAERQEIYSVTQAVYHLKTNIEATVTRVGAEEAVNLKKLAKVYAAMPPEGAAHIFREMEDEQIVKILALMKESESALILEGISQGTKDEAKRAALLSNRLRLIVASDSPRKTSPP
ncbi:MAG: MotE family protein [Limisphaerales bacterium]